jgi:hypothetical protein
VILPYSRASLDRPKLANPTQPNHLAFGVPHFGQSADIASLSDIKLLHEGQHVAVAVNVATA